MNDAHLHTCTRARRSYRARGRFSRLVGRDYRLEAVSYKLSLLTRYEELPSASTRDIINDTDTDTQSLSCSSCLPCTFLDTTEYHQDRRLRGRGWTGPLQPCLELGCKLKRKKATKILPHQRFRRFSYRNVARSQGPQTCPGSFVSAVSVLTI